MKTKLRINFDKVSTAELPCFKIDIPLYRCHILVLDKKQSKRLGELWGSPDDYGAMVNNYLKESQKIILRVFEYSDANIVHELHHTVDMIMDYIDHEKNAESDEPSAYLMTYLYEEVMKIKKYLK